MREDEEQFREYCDRSIGALLRFGFALTGNRDAAADLVQTALARTYAAWARVLRRDAPDAYVRRTMVNELANQRRAGRRRETAVAEPPEHGAPDEALAKLRATVESQEVTG